jgi:hypothetical protein
MITILLLLNSKGGLFGLVGGGIGVGLFIFKKKKEKVNIVLYYMLIMLSFDIGKTPC